MSANITWGFGPFVFRECRVDFNSNTEVNNYAQPMAVIHGWEKSLNWWIGDLFAQGERVHGEDIWNAVPDGMDQVHVEVCMAVAKAVPRENRRSDLSWSCHREVCKLAPEVQKVCLSVAASKGWGNLELREYVQKWKRNSKTGLSV